MSLVNSFDLSNWYERLNNIRNKNGINLGDETVETVSSNNIISLNSIEILQEKINSLKGNIYLNYAQYNLNDLENINNNTIISENIKKNIDDTLTSLEGICANDSTCSTTENSTYNQSCKTYSATPCTDYNRNSTGNATYSQNSTCGTCGTNVTCDTRSTNTDVGYGTGSNSRLQNSIHSVYDNSTCSDCTTGSAYDSDCITYNNSTYTDRSNTGCSNNSTNNDSCKTLQNSTDSTYAVTS